MPTVGSLPPNRYVFQTCQLQTLPNLKIFFENKFLKYYRNDLVVRTVITFFGRAVVFLDGDIFCTG